MANPLSLDHREVSDPAATRNFEQIRGWVDNVRTVDDTQNTNITALQGRATSLETTRTEWLNLWVPHRTQVPMRTVAATGTTEIGPSASGGYSVAVAADREGDSFDLVAPAALAGYTLQIRLVALIETNATAPGVNFTYQLRPITPGGGAGVSSFTAGAAVINLGVGAPAASAATIAVSGGISHPTDGAYFITAKGQVGQAANSHVTHKLSIERRWV